MTIKRTKYQVGPFERGYIEAEMGDSESFQAILEIVQANSPTGRISVWRPHAERLNIAVDLLNEAQGLIDKNGAVKQMDRFNHLMAKAEMVSKPFG